MDKEIKGLSLRHCSLILCLVLATVPGCLGSQQPIALPEASSARLSPAVALRTSASWTAPEAKNADLLYIASEVKEKTNRDHVLIFTYPNGKLVGDLSGFYYPIYGLCIDKTGDVFVADLNGGEVREYAHGSAKPILTLQTHGAPFGCAIDPTTGDLAVPLFCDGPSGSCYSEGTILIYPKARERPKRLTDPNIAQPYFSTYNSAGDLFINGLAGAFYTGTYDELAHGSSSFVNLTLKKLPKAEQPGGIQWSGGDLAVAPIAAGNAIYGYHISGSLGTRISVANLAGVPPHHGVVGFWVQGKTLIAPEWNIRARQGIGQVQLFSYPSGGKPIATINHVFYFPTAAAVSLAPRH
jgi:hypothetical protein